MPLVASRQHGTFSLRDIDLATGHVPPGPSETQAGRGADQRGVCGDAVEELTALEQSVSDAIAALNTIDAKMRSEGGPEVAPTSTRCPRIS